MICIIDYQSGNLGAIVNMFKKLGVKAQIISSPDQMLNATKIILPGIGTFDTGMKNLISGGWLDLLNHNVLVEKKPTLGICLGMQLMTGGSEEGKLEGLNWLNGYAKKFQFEDKNVSLKVPHMGWNKASLSKKSKLLQSNDNYENRFYFAHGYYVDLTNKQDELLQTVYGFPFSSAFEKENILGVQFHPEKSHRFGMELLRNFVINY